MIFENYSTTGEPEETRTEILYGMKDALGRGVQFMKNAKRKMDICYDHSGPSIVIEVSEYRNGFSDILKRGGQIRVITEITKENLRYCKELMKIVTELHHMDGIKGGIAINDTEYMATTILQEAKPLSQVIYSNVKEVVQQGQYIYDTFWNKSISAEHKIKEIEEGIEPTFLQVITDHNKASNILLNLSRSAKREVLFILPNDKALMRMDRIGVLNYLVEASKNGADVRIICPLTETNSTVVKDIERTTPSVRFVNGNITQCGIIIVDDSQFLAAELENPSADQFSEAIGFALHSNSIRFANLLKLFFEGLWKQIEMSRQLEIRDEMQREFVNIAAHELRTPIQPILGLSNILLRHMQEKNNNNYNEQDGTLLDVINRNAKRLYMLTENLLDVAKIENQSLTLRKELFGLSSLIYEVIGDKRTLSMNNNAVNILLASSDNIKDKDDDLYVYADRERIMQVISNLVDNAVKFTKNGTISITLNLTNNDHSSQVAVVEVKDEGTGIDIEVSHKLFTKFATKSDKGMGLGLYISKGLIEAHGGKIWGENNKDGKGATFTFTLPVTEKGSDLI